MSIYNIQNTKDLRDAYIFLGFEKELGVPYGSIANIIRSAIRAWNNRPEPKEKVVKGDFDRVITLIEFPDWVKTLEDAEDYFCCNYHRAYVPTYYDCTGQIFTSWHKCFKRRGKWMCYHGMAVDC